ncbi:MAG TPA: hypothetical protein VHE34_02810 [Puia sp.]|uniref:hypothetical protein n=1 Tax=Puia sp. TaxID=2045100 RepID=UPI002B649EFC|nr:hypothetical protein [Puia sp.]HVU94120.1 hypothetical protein [Puia sp.]
MKRHFTFSRALCAPLLISVILLYSCEPSVRLTASWSDREIQPGRFSRVLVASFGKDLEKRKLGEDHIKAELERRGFMALTSLDVFGPNFATMDSAKMRQLLLGGQFDGVVTVRVLSVNEQDRWVPGGFYYGPVGYYRGYYGYYYRVGRYYSEPGYVVTDVEVLLESNLYRVATGELLWSGQSKAFSRNPTDAMAKRYARNIVDDMMQKGVLILGR